MVYIVNIIANCLIVCREFNEQSAVGEYYCCISYWRSYSFDYIELFEGCKEIFI